MKKLLVFFVCLVLSAPLFADMHAAVGQFTKAAGTPAFSQTVTDTNFGGGTPKALILWSTSQTSNAFATGAAFGIGISTDSTHQVAICNADTNGASTTANNGRYTATAITTCTGGAGAITEAATLSSFGTNSFTLSWTTGASAGVLYNYIMLGGTDMTNAQVLEPTMPTGTGHHSFTGMGFQPDFLFFLTSAQTAHAVQGGLVSFGFATSSSAQATNNVGFAATGQTVAANARATKFQTAANIINALSGAISPAITADFISMDADGFTVNESTAPGSGRLFGVLGLKGGTYTVGSYTKSTAGAPASQSITGMATAPVLVVQSSFHNVASGSILADANMSLGASVGSGKSVNSWWYAKDATIPTVTDVYQDITNVLTLNTGPSTADAVASMTSLDAAGFTESWNPNTATGDQIVYFAIGPTVATGKCAACDLSLLEVPFLHSTGIGQSVGAH